MKAKKELYREVENNVELYNVVHDLETVKEVIEADFYEYEEEDKKEVQYTVTPIYLTKRQYDNLPEN